MAKFISVFVSTLFLSINFGAVLNINSARLSEFFDSRSVSMLFVLGAVGNILLFLIAPKLIEGFGKRKLLLILLLLVGCSTFGLAYGTTNAVIAISFLIYSSFSFIIYYIFDIFLEEASKDTRTGEIRGLYMTVLNFGIMLGPLILVLAATNDSLVSVYLVATALLIVPVLIAIFDLRSRAPHWHGLHKHHALLPFRLWWRTKNIRRITLVKLVLEFFFAIMVIYVPIYLRQEIGFEWAELGVMFTIMLLPFVILEWPAGELADRFLGEKELLISGFILMIIALAIMPMLGGVFIAWTLVLLASRVGASLVEIMAESYFFKHVDAAETRLISIYRLARPFGIIVGSTVGAIALNLVSFEKIFFITAIVVIWGLKEGLLLKDTL